MNIYIYYCYIYAYGECIYSEHIHFHICFALHAYGATYVPTPSATVPRQALTARADILLEHIYIHIGVYIYIYIPIFHITI